MHPAALVALAGSVFLIQVVTLRIALGGWQLWPDAMEYLLIGNSWAHGSGFVNPVQWFQIPGAGPVIHAFVVRSVVVPFFVGVALWFGATVLTVIKLHAAWSSAVVGIVALGATRMMRLPAAAAAALWLGTFPAWVKLSQMPMTETTAVATMIAVLMSIRWAARSVVGAILCGALSVVAWLTRPNLAGLALAVFVAIVTTTPGRTLNLRHIPAWIYALTFGVGVLLICGAMFASTGFMPYSGYAVLGGLLERGAYAQYAPEPTGLLEMVTVRREYVLAAALEKGTALLRELFVTDRFGRVGWLGLPGVLWCLWGGLHHRLERRFTALCALGFGVGVFFTLAYWDVYRFPFLSAAAAALCGAALLDDLCLVVARRLSPGRTRWAIAVAPLVLALVVVATAAPPVARMYANLGWPLRDVQRVKPVLYARDRSLQRVCREIPPDVLVAGAAPWGISFWCGNPTIKSPSDFRNPTIRSRFLQERQPTYFVESKKAPVPRGRGEVRLEPIRSIGQFTLDKVVGVTSQLQWNPPPPVGCAGRPPSCLEAVGR